jgi:hypothetical protein
MVPKQTAALLPVVPYHRRNNQSFLLEIFADLARNGASGVTVLR